VLAVLHVVIQESHGQFFSRSKGFKLGYMGKRGLIKSNQDRTLTKREDDKTAVEQLESDSATIYNEKREISPRVGLATDPLDEAKVMAVIQENPFLRNAIFKAIASYYSRFKDALSNAFTSDRDLPSGSGDYSFYEVEAEDDDDDDSYEGKFRFKN
jgi:hypothetical protein